MSDTATGSIRPAEIVTWETVCDHIWALHRLKPGWDGDDAPAIRGDIISSALDLARFLCKSGFQPADDVYPMSENSVVIEWQLPGKIITRYKVTSAGRGRQMISYPDRKPSFHDLSWPTHCAVDVFQGLGKRDASDMFQTSSKPTSSYNTKLPTGQHRQWISEDYECMNYPLAA